MLVAFVLAGVARSSLALLVLVIVLLDVAIQGLNILNDTRLFAVAGDARSRVNTAGSWTGVTTAGSAVAVVGLTVGSLGRRGPRVVPA